MGLRNLLVANRGEIAIRVMRAARDLGLETVAVAPEDDLGSLHTRVGRPLPSPRRSGPGAYLDIDSIIAAATEHGCDSVHPGYGFLAENAALAQACDRARAGLRRPDGRATRAVRDKVAARDLAAAVGVPLAPGPTATPRGPRPRRFLAQHGPMMIKAVAGGGGRGMRPVRPGQDVAGAWDRARSEAEAAFGNPAVYVESLIERARHIEVQVIGDGDAVIHVGERECTLQRQNQKIVEVAPSPSLEPETRRAVTSAAVAMAAEVGYRSLGTWEFLVDAEDQQRIAFMETNARLQVEHTVTEEVTGLDLVQIQLRLAGGETLADLGLGQDRVPEPRGHAVQARINTETMTADGTARPAGGTLQAFDPPTGPGIRTDTYGYVGYTTNPGYDSLLAKVVGHSPGPRYQDALARVRRALSEFRVVGVATNIGFLQALLDRSEVVANNITTSFVTERATELVEAGAQFEQRYFSLAAEADQAPGLAGAQVDSTDPLAVLTHGALDGSVATPAPERGPSGLGPPPPPPPPPPRVRPLPVNPGPGPTAPSRSRPRCRAPSWPSTLPRAIRWPRASSSW